jgi:oxaloacetate decarboxylase (Na+ extruding) subunit alpha
MDVIDSSGKIRFVDTTLRDGHLSLWASNMRTGMMLPVAERLDRAGFEAIEVMSSAFYKKCVRDLKEDPWERLRLLKQRMRRTPLRSIRSRSMLAFQITPAAVAELWLERLAANGIDQLRTSDPSNTASYWKHHLFNFTQAHRRIFRLARQTSRPARRRAHLFQRPGRVAHP